MDTKTKGKIINALRKLTFAYSPRNSAKNRQKVSPAAFRCEGCEVIVYEGRKELDKAGLEEFDNKIKDKTYLDHIEPVIPLKSFQKGSWDWDEYINRMFCEQNGFQVLCKKCHDEKTDLENEERKQYRLSKKGQK